MTEQELIEALKNPQELIEALKNPQESILPQCRFFATKRDGWFGIEYNGRTLFIYPRDCKDNLGYVALLLQTNLSYHWKEYKQIISMESLRNSYWY